MKKILSILFLFFVFGGTAHADIQVLDCRQIIEVDDDVGKDIVIKHIVQIDLESETIKVLYENGEPDILKISSVTEDSIEAILKLKSGSGSNVLAIHRYTLELKYHFFDNEAKYQGASTPFECKKLEQKI